MMTYLLERSMDKRVEQKTRETYAKFYGISQLDAVYLTKYLFTQHSYINKNNFKSVPHVGARLRIVLYLLENGTKF
jgi:hypothetical protein